MALRFGVPNYELTLPKGWVVKAAQVIKLTLMVLKIALTCAGLPIPIPQLPADLLVGGGCSNGGFLGMLDKLEVGLNMEVSTAQDAHTTNKCLVGRDRCILWDWSIINRHC